MAAAQTGDQQAYRQLLMQLRPWLNGYFRKRLRGPDTEDLVQMTLLSVHEKRHTYDPTALFLPWIAAIARHKLIDFVRKAKHRVYIEFDEETMGEGDGFLFGSAELAMRDVECLLAQLPKDQAHVIRLQKLGEMSVEEVASVTGKSPSNVKVTVHRGLKRLQALVGLKSDALDD